MRIKNVLITILLISVFLTNCNNSSGGGSSTDKEGSQLDVDSALTKIQLLFNQETNPSTIEEDLEEIKDLFSSSLSKDPNNSTANLGMSLFWLLDLKTDEDVNLIAELIFRDEFPTNDDGLTASYIQTIINSLIISSLDKSKTYLDKAISNIDSSSINISIEGEPREIDKADLLLLKAGIESLYIAPYFLSVFNLSMTDPLTDEEFILSMTNYQDRNILDIIDANINNTNSDFLKFKNGENLAKIKNSLLTITNTLNQAYTSLTNETDDQSNDILPKDNIAIPEELVTEINKFLSFLSIEETYSSIPQLISLIEDAIETDTVLVPVTLRYRDYVDYGGYVAYELIRETQNFQIKLSSFFDLYNSGDFPNGIKGELESSTPDYTLGETILTEFGATLTETDFEFFYSALYTSIFEPFEY